MPKNRQHNRKTKYPDKVTKPKRLVFVRIFLFSSVGIKIQYFPTTPLIQHSSIIPVKANKLIARILNTYLSFRKNLVT